MTGPHRRLRKGIKCGTTPFFAAIRAMLAIAVREHGIARGAAELGLSPVTVASWLRLMGQTTNVRPQLRPDDAQRAIAFLSGIVAEDKRSLEERLRDLIQMGGPIAPAQYAEEFEMTAMELIDFADRHSWFEFYSPGSHQHRLICLSAEGEAGR